MRLLTCRSASAIHSAQAMPSALMESGGGNRTSVAATSSMVTVMSGSPSPSLRLAVPGVEQRVEDAVGHLDHVAGRALDRRELLLVDLGDHVGVGVVDDALHHLLARGLRVLRRGGQ